MKYGFDFAGWIFDVTQNYNLPFVTSGMIGFTGSTILLTLCIVMKIRDRRELKQKQLHVQEVLTSPNPAITRTLKEHDERIRTITC